MDNCRAAVWLDWSWYCGEVIIVGGEEREEKISHALYYGQTWLYT